MKIIICFFSILIFVLNNTHCNKDSIFHIIKSTNGHIFNQMRSIKENFHPEIQKAFEKSIKEYEYRYLSNKEDFVNFLWDKFEHLKYLKETKEDNLELEYNNQVYDFLKEFLTFYNTLNNEEKIKVDEIVEKEHSFTKDIIKSAKESSVIYDDNKFADLSSIIENLPSFLIKNNTDMTYKNKKINEDFKSFLDMINQEYNIHQIHKESSYLGKLNKTEEIIKNLKPNHKIWLSSFLQEYMKEAVIDNDDFKHYYTLNKMKEINLPEIKKVEEIEHKKHLNLLKKPKNGPFRFKILNSNVMTNPSPSTSTKPDLGKSFGVLEKIIKNNISQREEAKKKEIFDTSGNCDEKDEKLNSELDKQLKIQEEKKNSEQNDLKEVPSNILKVAGDPKASSQLAIDLLKKFLQKLIVLLVKHIPFYFFKFCIPPGPLVFGCCPEAAFFPQQLYNVFTALEKVDKFKSVAKGYPDWLSSIGHDNFSEVKYYICAQSFLTVHESALFNICNPLSLVFTNPMNLMGLLPGDWPLCFVSCIQVNN